MSKVKVIEPVVNPENYKSSLSAAFNWYNQEKDKKDARSYLKDYITQHFTKNDIKVFDKVSDGKIISTYGWISRMVLNGTLTLNEADQNKFSNYLQIILDTSDLPVEEPEVEKVARPSVCDNMKEKVNEYLGELEGAIDDFLIEGKELNLYNDLKNRTIPQPYCPFIEEWIKKKAGEYIEVYESSDEQIKEGYSHLGKRKVTQLIKLISSWTEDLDRYSQFKKANRKPRAKKVKPAGVQVAKLKYKREDSELGIKSVLPPEMVGASQVWVYNTKYKKLAVYRSDSSSGIQVKGTTLQNYEPDLCEQKTLRKPKETLKEVLNAGKVQLRRIIPELTTKESPVNGRINEDCLIIRVIM
jgi:hypothetical protein